MSDDLLGFFNDIPDEGFNIAVRHCTEGQCNVYEGNINPNDIWTFYLTSQDREIRHKVETSLEDYFEPIIRFSMKDISVKVSPEDFKVIENGVLSGSTSNGNHEFDIIIKKV